MIFIKKEISHFNSELFLYFLSLNLMVESFNLYNQCYRCFSLLLQIYFLKSDQSLSLINIEGSVYILKLSILIVHPLNRKDFPSSTFTWSVIPAMTRYLFPLFSIFSIGPLLYSSWISRFLLSYLNTTNNVSSFQNIRFKELFHTITNMPYKHSFSDLCYELVMY